MLEQIELQKAELRHEMRVRLAGVDAGQVRASSAAVMERLAVLPVFAAAKAVFVYVSFGHEIETHGLIRQLLALGRQVGIPAFHTHRQEYDASELLDFDADLKVTGKMKLLEPREECVRPVRIERFDVLL